MRQIKLVLIVLFLFLLSGCTGTDVGEALTCDECEVCEVCETGKQDIVIPEYSVPEISGTVDVVYVIGEDIPDYLYGVTVMDSEYGDITNDLIVDDSNVNYDVVGDYVVTYQVFNEDGNYDYAGIKVSVVLPFDEAAVGDDFVIFQEDSLFGIMDLNGTVVVDNVYEQISYLGEEVVVLRLGDNVAYYDLFNNEYVQFNGIPFAFNEGVSPYYLNGYYGYVSRSGEVIRTAIFDYAGEMTNYKKAVFGTYDEDMHMMKYGVINELGEIIVAPIYEEIVLGEANFLGTIDGSTLLNNYDNDMILELDSMEHETYWIDTTVIYGYYVQDTVVFLNENFTLFNVNGDPYPMFLNGVMHYGYETFYLVNIEGTNTLFNNFLSISRPVAFSSFDDFYWVDNYLLYIDEHEVALYDDNFINIEKTYYNDPIMYVTEHRVDLYKFQSGSSDYMLYIDIENEGLIIESYNTTLHYAHDNVDSDYWVFSSTLDEQTYVFTDDGYKVIDGYLVTYYRYDNYLRFTFNNGSVGRFYKVFNGTVLLNEANYYDESNLFESYIVLRDQSDNLYDVFSDSGELLYENALYIYSLNRDYFGVMQTFDPDNDYQLYSIAAGGLSFETYYTVSHLSMYSYYNENYDGIMYLAHNDGVDIYSRLYVDGVRMLDFEVDYSEYISNQYIAFRDVGDSTYSIYDRYDDSVIMSGLEFVDVHTSKGEIFVQIETSGDPLYLIYDDELNPLLDTADYFTTAPTMKSLNSSYVLLQEGTTYTYYYWDSGNELTLSSTYFYYATYGNFVLFNDASWNYFIYYLDQTNVSTYFITALPAPLVPTFIGEYFIVDGTLYDNEAYPQVNDVEEVYLVSDFMVIETSYDTMYFNTINDDLDFIDVDDKMIINVEEMYENKVVVSTTTKDILFERQIGEPFAKVGEFGDIVYIDNHILVSNNGSAAEIFEYNYTYGYYELLFTVDNEDFDYDTLTINQNNQVVEYLFGNWFLNGGFETFYGFEYGDDQFFLLENESGYTVVFSDGSYYQYVDTMPEYLLLDNYLAIYNDMAVIFDDDLIVTYDADRIYYTDLPAEVFFDVFYIEENGQFGLISVNGNEIIPAIYDQIIYDDGMYIARNGNLYTLYDSYGNMIVEHYTYIDVVNE